MGTNFSEMVYLVTSVQELKTNPGQVLKVDAHGGTVSNS